VGADRQVCLLDAASGAAAGSFEAGKRPPTGAALLGDGASLLAGSTSLSLYDVATHERVRKFTGHAVRPPPQPPPPAPAAHRRSEAKARRPPAARGRPMPLAR
jgi:hypothetical protein